MALNHACFHLLDYLSHRREGLHERVTCVNISRKGYESIERLALNPVGCAPNLLLLP